VLSNTMLGLQSVDRNLMELFRLYGAPASQSASARLEARLKALWYLRRPAALPAFLAGLRIAGGLSLIGAVVAEMAAGSSKLQERPPAAKSAHKPRGILSMSKPQ